MGAEEDKILGVGIVGVASFLYAAGLCIQRAALTVDDPSGPVAGCRGSCCRKHSTINWVIGLVIYGVGGLFLSTISLRWIPLSLSSSIFSSVLIFNAIIARLWLKEPVQLVDVVCYALIMGGITVDAYYLPDAPQKVDVQILEQLWEEPLGIAFWAVVLSALISLQVVILVYLERKHEVNGSYEASSRAIYKVAMVSYPVALGIWEGVAYMCLKAANDIFDHIGNGRNDQTEHWLFWLGVSIALPQCAVIVMWVRKAYKRFPTTQIFPLELGALTVVSVNGGLLFFKEYQGAKTHELYLCYAGVGLMIVAMITLAWYKASGAGVVDVVGDSVAVVEAESGSGARDDSATAQKLGAAVPLAETSPVKEISPGTPACESRSNEAAPGAAAPIEHQPVATDTGYAC